MHIAAIEKLTERLFAKRWKKLHGDNFAAPDLKYPGVYLLAHSQKNLEGRKAHPKDVFYVGMTCSAGGLRQRLKQFRQGVEKNNYHSGAMRFYREFAKNKAYSKLKSTKRFFYANLSFECVSDKAKASPKDFVQFGHISAVEYYAISRVYQRTRKKPALNKLGGRPII